MTGVAGHPLSGTISISDPGVASLSVSISGVPVGMTFSVSSTIITAYWVGPMLGNYNLNVSVVDSDGHSAQANVLVTISAM